MDYIAGSFYDGFLLYAMALEETLAEGGAQNDGISITMKMQNRRIWGKKKLKKKNKNKNWDLTSCENFTFFQYPHNSCQIQLYQHNCGANNVYLYT